MADITVTLKNYRCFEDTQPAVITIGDGFTAFVGPNNVGKSTLVRLFYELRQVAEAARTSITGTGLMQPKVIGVYDPLEIFCDRNTRDLTLELSLPKPSEMDDPGFYLRKLTITQRRSGEWAYEPQWFTNKGEIGRPPTRKIGDNPKLSKHSELMTETLSDLQQSLYIGPFRSAVSEGGNAEYYDLTIGSRFVALWHEWQTGPLRSQNVVIQKATADIQRLFGFNSLDISASQATGSLQVTIDRKPYKLRELGAGIAQFIIVLGTVALKKPAFVFIDEPELNLHPSLQIAFLTTLGSYAKRGVVFSTHSLGLARSTAESIYSLKRIDGGNRITTFEQTPNYAEFLGEMSFSSFKELGAEQILLVEGTTDVKTMQQFLRMYGKDHLVVVLPLGGSSLARDGVTHELSELIRITPRVAALVDSEKESVEAPPKHDRSQFETICRELGFNVHLTRRRATENYLTDEAIKEVKGEKYSALGPYERLKDRAIQWGKDENWKIAKAMRLEDIDKTDIGEFLRSL